MSSPRQTTGAAARSRLALGRAVAAATLCERVRYHAKIGDTMIEADVIVTTPEEWVQMPQSLSRDWKPVESGPILVAHRISL